MQTDANTCSTHYAPGSRLCGRITLADAGAKYTKAFGRPGGYARHGKKWGPQGVTHQAWGKSATPAHTFMLPGKKVAFIREKYAHGGSRPMFTPRGKKERITVIYGASVPREIQRHATEARRDVEQATSRTVVPEIERQIELAMRSAKSKHGL